MGEDLKRLEFQSPLAPLMEEFLEEKRACGYRYERGSLFLLSLDRFLRSEGLSTEELPREMVERWTAKKAHERSTNQQARVSYVREFARFLVRHDHDAFIPTGRIARSFPYNFAPHVFSFPEIREILLAADRMRPDRNARLQHIVIPEIVRVLYGCGLRAGEARKLTVGDVNLAEGILHIRKAKFRKDRLVPVAQSLLDRLRRYAARMGERSTRAIFFPTARGGQYSTSSLYNAFRFLLRAAKIPHGGRGKGPRLHDVRHTFAIHRLVRWYREGVDLNAKLPVLAAYMGHIGLKGTQRYLHLIADLFPEVAARQEAAFGQVIPTRGEA
jgi:integrase/recombinase XerD